jgi:predicted RNase H-like nuclease
VTATVAGVDGCRAGWVCVLRQVEPPFEERAFVARRFGDILGHPAKPSVIAVDIPIGFPERIAGGGRECDCSVRTILGKRASSVFAPPARAVLSETDYRRACAAALATSDPPRQISKQMFHLFAKVREVDEAITPESSVFECHPEAAFWAMNGGVPLAEPKKLRGRPHMAGLERRETLLMMHGFSEVFLREARFPRSQAGHDDVLDACACSWTAARIFRGEAISFPARAVADARGLRMAIFA